MELDMNTSVLTLICLTGQFSSISNVCKVSANRIQGIRTLSEHLTT